VPIVPRGRRPGSNISPTDAHQILQDLIREGKISVGDIARYREIRKLEERLQSLRGGGGMPGRRAARVAGPQAGRVVRRRVRRLSAAGLASRKVQGRYLGLIRQIPASQRGKYTKIAKEKSREAAIKEMQSALGK
jgi:hypothetical protein